MRPVLYSEIQKERCNAAAVGAFNKSLHWLKRGGDLTPTYLNSVSEFAKRKALAYLNKRYQNERKRYLETNSLKKANIYQQSADKTRKRLMTIGNS